MDYEEKVSCFKRYIKQSMDLLEDAYKWKMMAKYCDDGSMKQKYMTVSNALFEMFMVEHGNIGNMFKEED